MSTLRSSASITGGTLSECDFLPRALPACTKVLGRTNSLRRVCVLLSIHYFSRHLGGSLVSSKVQKVPPIFQLRVGSRRVL